MLRFAFFVAAAYLTGPALAQDETPALPRAHVVFEGGTVAEYYATLRGVMPDIRLAVHPDAEQVEMPRVELPDISAWSAVQLPSKLIDGVEASYILDADRGGDLDTATYTVSVEPGLLELIHETPETFDLDFEGGSFGSFVGLLREETDANIVVDQYVAVLPMEPLTLRRATISNVLGVLDRSWESAGQDPQRIDVVRSGSETGNELFVVRLQETQADVPLGRPGTRTWSLAAIFETGAFDAGDVLGAIETSEEFFAGEVQVRYHEGTRVLIARGYQEDLGVIEQLIDRITESAHTLGRAR